MRKRKGISLVEVILTIALVGMVIQVAYSILFAGTNSYSVSTAKGFAQQDVRIAADYLSDELRSATDISEVDYEYGEYYSFKLNDEGKLIKTRHVYNDDDTFTETIVRVVNGNSDSISIVNTQLGKIEVSMKQVEKVGGKESEFILPFTIFPENAPFLLSNVLIDLADGDVLYFRNTKLNSLANGIYLDTESEETGVETVDVKFYQNDGSTGLHQMVSGASESIQNLPSKPNRSGFSFVGWNTKSDGTGTSYGTVDSTSFTMPTSDTDVFAIWIEFSELLTKVVIDNTENDGIISIDNETTFTKSGDRYEIDKASGNNTKNINVKIKLKNYTSAHYGKVSISVNNSPVAFGGGNDFTFTVVVTSNGANNPIDVSISIKTEGHAEADAKTYKFITK